MIANYGCHNRTVSDGYCVKIRRYKCDGTYDMVDKFIAHRMTTDCRYDKSKQDVRCGNCKNIGEENERG